VRLGLVLAEIGRRQNVQVTDQEVLAAAREEALRYPGQEQQVFDALRNNANALTQLRAPLYEDKVVDFLFSKAKISERKATRAELEADLEAEEGHVHGPGCGHDHGHDHAPAKGKKSGSKAKTAKAEDKLVAEEPAKGAVEKSSTKPKPAKPLKDGAGSKAPAAKAKPDAKAKPEAKTKKAPAKKAPAKKAPAKKA